MPSWMTPPPWWQVPQWQQHQQQLLVESMPQYQVDPVVQLQTATATQPSLQTVHSVNTAEQSTSQAVPTAPHTVTTATMQTTVTEDAKNTRDATGHGHTSQKIKEKDADSESEADTGMTYLERIRYVREMMGEEEEVIEDTKATARSVDKQVVRGKAKLPCSESFNDWFKDFEREVRGETAEGKKYNKALDMGSFPKGLRPSMKPYQLERCPWEKSPRANPSLMESTIFPYKYMPKVSIKYFKMEDLENCSRDMLGMASYSDTFLWATKETIKEAMKKLDTTRYQEVPSMNLEQIQDLHENLETSLELLQSSARGLQDVIKGTVNNIGNLVLCRRDAFLEGMLMQVPQEMKSMMRQNSINADLLFDTDVVERAKKLVTEEKKEKVLFGGEREEHRAFRGNTRGGPTQRGGRGGRGRANANLWTKKEETPKHNFRGRGRGRGGSNRGQ